MVTNQVLQSTLDDLKAITKVDLCVMDPEGFLLSTTFDNMDIKMSSVLEFSKSLADSQEIQGYHFFKIYSEKVMEYILLSRGINEDAYMIGKIAVSQIQHLIIAYKEHLDKNNFIQNLVMDNLLLVDIYNRAKKLQISLEAKRVVILVETKNEKDINAMEIIKGLFAGNAKDFVTSVDEHNIILLKQIGDNEDYQDIEHTCHMIMDMLNTEAMTQARISYGNIINEIKHVSKSYKEAKMALDVGKIFYMENRLLSYNSLGIGRLIYQLPIPLCKMFIKEVFGDTMPDSFDEETLATIKKFFDNNLNISETSRQLYVHRNTLVYRLEKLQKTTGLDIRVFDDALTFKIALMVVSYMKYVNTLE